MITCRRINVVSIVAGLFVWEFVVGAVFCEHLPLGFLLPPFVAEAAGTLFVIVCRKILLPFVADSFFYYLLLELFLVPCVARLFLRPFVALSFFVIVCRSECFGFICRGCSFCDRLLLKRERECLLELGRR